MRKLKRSVSALLSAVLVMGIAGCGSGESKPTIALLLPEKQAPRYEAVDRPAFEKKVAEACGGCEVVYRNAEENEAKQSHQAKAALEAGVDVLVLGPTSPQGSASIVEEARAKGVPVLLYDQVVDNSKPDVLVSFDYAGEGELQAEALAKKLKEEGHARGPIVMIVGEPGGPSQHLFEAGALHRFHATGVKIARKDDTPFWGPKLARQEMHKAISAIGPAGFAGVYAETDSIATGVVAAMEAAGIDPASKPTTGRAATLVGLRRILIGEQYMTVYEPAEREATVAAEVAVELAQGNGVPRARLNGKVSNYTTQVPAILLPGVAVTKRNLDRAVVADGVVRASVLCAGHDRSACARAGITW